MADLELPIPGENGNVAIVALRPPSGYLREPDGTWVSLGDGSLGVPRDGVRAVVGLLESENLVAVERDETAQARAFDVQVHAGDAEVKRARVWICAAGYVVKLERSARGERMVGVEFDAIGEPPAFLEVPSVLKQAQSTPPEG